MSTQYSTRYEEDDDYDDDFDDDAADNYNSRFQVHEGKLEFDPNFDHGEGNYSWREMIADQMGKYGESMKDVVASSGRGEDWMDQRFNITYGGPNGAQFTMWTEERVYVPMQYDGQDQCISVPRNPDGEATAHIR